MTGFCRAWTVCSGLHLCKHLYFPHNRQAEVVTNTKLWHNGGILTEQDQVTIEILPKKAATVTGNIHFQQTTTASQQLIIIPLKFYMAQNHSFIFTFPVAAPLAGFYIKQCFITYINNQYQLEFTGAYWKIGWLGSNRLGLICGGGSMLPPSTCFTGSRLVLVDRRGNVLKCYILLTAFGSQFSIASIRYVQTPAREKESTEREGEVAARVQPCHSPEQ